MRAMLKKPVAVALPALLLGAGAVGAASSPALAWEHGGPGGPGGGPWHHGYYGGGHWHGGGWGPAVGLGILGLAAGVAIASQSQAYPPPAYDYGPGPDSCTSYQPVYDHWGRYIGRRWVDICQ